MKTTKRILITGSEGLVGRALRVALRERGVEVCGLDVRARGDECGDVGNADDVARAMEGCDGVVHLAAISRVVWAEDDPSECERVNVGGVRNVLASARRSPKQPWVLFSSSREVYGHVAALPATEETPVAPVNTYGRSKAHGERQIAEAAASGHRASVVRLSNVYGDPRDHVDRVVPAFARAAVDGGELRVEGSNNTFDFVYISDAVRGLMALIERLDADGPLPPTVHLVTGEATSLGTLAQLAMSLADAGGVANEHPARAFDVAVFEGDPSRAEAELGWRAEVSLEEGLSRLIAAMRR